MHMGLIMSRSKTSLPFHCMVCLPIVHHSLLCTLLVKISVILHLYPLRINNPNPIILMPMSLNPWGKHMKLPKITLWLVSGFIQDIPLKGLRFLMSLCQMLPGTLSINHHHYPYILWWEEDLLYSWKGKIWSYRGEAEGHWRRGWNYGFADLSELCLVPDVVIPPKFMVPDFYKYKGTTCL